MESLHQASKLIHILAGTATLLAGPVAIFYNYKNPVRHRLAGKVFFYAMLIVCGSAVAGYLRQPDRVFFQFLMGIALLVFVNIVRGVRAIRLMKGASIGAVDGAYTAALGLGGIGMIAMAVLQWQQGAGTALVILFGVFGAGAIADTLGHVRLLRHPESIHRLDWYRVHVMSMLTAFIASTTAFTVNAAPFLPWYLQWFGPTLLLVPLQVYFGRKIKAQKAQQVRDLRQSAA